MKPMEYGSNIMTAMPTMELLVEEPKTVGKQMLQRYMQQKQHGTRQTPMGIIMPRPSAQSSEGSYGSGGAQGAPGSRGGADGAAMERSGLARARERPLRRAGDAVCDAVLAAHI